MIPAEMLILYGAIEVKLDKDELLFGEGESCLHYFQVQAGAIKMVNYSDEGQEFIQGVFGPGESFGEPPLFDGFPYPGSAMATTASVVCKLRKERFIDLLRDHFEIHLQFSAVFAKRLRYKSMMLRELSSYAPEHRLMTLIEYFRDKSGGSSAQPFQVPFTRQQLADMTGLRVETVIRTISKLHKEGRISLIKHKIYSR
ncbi:MULTISPECIES: Crp/Fnr family transcriptional regulator [unclassified Spirosoma]|uniref:Crp/Fnr family transcriptional regulator n=1 Tax=unclassified Spirosoma TaxID=2621999 RepID=UPI00095A5912|nr:MULTISPECIES: Crp/Fnr family transcriptional regulator [unclassified Spirosoma]MBN8820432.1 Crp/Fnr family transcriptional regulator [Spirosoma sp.]OJW70014.1 MAG: cyclic nucleotide-binding protein [Spirosoma sp. 48-14]